MNRRRLFIVLIFSAVSFAFALWLARGDNDGEGWPRWIEVEKGDECGVE